MKKFINRGVFVGIVGFLLSTIIWQSNIAVSVENLTWDARVRLLADSSKASDKIVLILLGQDSLDWAENEQGLSWPWPREILTTLIDFSKRSNAKSISFDVLYTEASIYGVWDDQSLGLAIEKSDMFIGSTTLNNNGNSTISLKNKIKIDGLKEWLELSSTKISNFKNITLPISEIQNNAEFIVNVQADPDFDGVYRRGQLFYIYNGEVVPSHALASYIVGQEKPVSISIKKGFLTIDDKIIPINNKGEAILNYRGKSGTYKNFRAANIINSDILISAGEKSLIDPLLLKDAHVLFGYKAAGLLDLRATPLSGKDTGVEIHATMLDNLLTNSFIAKQNIVTSLLITLLLCISVGFLFTRYQKLTKSLFFLILFTIIPVLVSFLRYKTGVWFPLIYTEMGIILTLIGSGILNYVTEGKQKRFIKNAFRQYLSPDFIENILQNPEQLKLGGEKKELTMFFSDLEGFTTISERLNPEELTKLINKYLTAMTDIILEEGGTIDKYEGDAIIAFWNAPIGYTDHAERCVRASIRCQKKLAEMRSDFFDSTGYNLRMRIGINTGDAIVGNMGSDTRFDYTMLGDSVNLASRLEGVNKNFGTYTIISQSTLISLGGKFSYREIGKIKVVGKNIPITIYEPMLKDEYTANKEDFESFNKGLNLFYNGEFDNALEVFYSLEKDPVAIKYIGIIKKLNLSDLALNKWDGVLRMSFK